VSAAGLGTVLATALLRKTWYDLADLLEGMGCQLVSCDADCQRLLAADAWELDSEFETAALRYACCAAAGRPPHLNWSETGAKHHLRWTGQDSEVRCLPLEQIQGLIAALGCQRVDPSWVQHSLLRKRRWGLAGPWKGKTADQRQWTAPE